MRILDFRSAHEHTGFRYISYERAYEHTLFWYLICTGTFFSTSLLESGKVCRDVGLTQNSYESGKHARLGNNIFY